MFDPKQERMSMDKTLLTLQTVDELYAGLYLRDQTADGEHVTVCTPTGRVLFVAMSHEEYIKFEGLKERAAR